MMQPQLAREFRAVLVYWLVEVHQAMKLEKSSLLLAVSLAHRYLCKCRVQRAESQLVGIACVLVAAGFEETHADIPWLDKIEYYMAGTCGKAAIAKMPCSILSALGHAVVVTTCFLDIF